MIVTIFSLACDMTLVSLGWTTDSINLEMVELTRFSGYLIMTSDDVETSYLSVNLYFKKV